MSKTTTEIGKERSEALNPGIEDALNERYGHLLPGIAEGVVDLPMADDMQDLSFCYAADI